VAEHVYVNVPVVDGVDVPSDEVDEPEDVWTPEVASDAEQVHGKVAPVCIDVGDHDAVVDGLVLSIVTETYFVLFMLLEESFATTVIL
jgi:hypothetical protein